MRRFIARQNIERFERLLDGELGSRERRMFEQLLAEARNELSWLENIWSRTCPHLTVPASIGTEAETYLDHVVMVRHANFGSLQAFDAAEGNLYLIAHHNFDRASVEQFARVKKRDAAPCEEAHNLQASAFIEDIEEADVFPTLKNWARRIGIRAIQTTSIFDHSGKLIGAFSTYYANPHSFSGEEREATSVSSQQFRSLLIAMQRTWHPC
ncbi:hypothetical protein FHX12_005853 [Rhizobium sp. BK609]|nr:MULTISPECIES: hypothetical protein [unclassified Rhizobium]MBB3387129.1 hypothetical protein [Rhizobium sp. BK098]MBB3618831.1 hypothetical protein [Rhizobium sp. BK609]MBB3684490.1 hypothetical protein [Rhizobium sp. BK612]